MVWPFFARASFVALVYSRRLPLQPAIHDKTLLSMRRHLPTSFLSYVNGWFGKAEAGELHLWKF
jgi:hypothetical protein